VISFSKIPRHVEAFQRWMEEHGYSSQSAESYAKTIKNFLSINPWGDEYKYTDIIAYFEKLSGSHLTTGTRKYILVHLKRYYDYLVYTRKRKDHPCGRLYLKGGRDRGIIQSDLFTMAELEELMNRREGWGRQPRRNRLILSLLIYQALCTEEVCRLKISDIDTDKGIVRIAGGRRRNGREIMLSPKQEELLFNYLKERRGAKKAEPFFLNQYGNGMSDRSVSDILLPFKEFFPRRELNPLMIRRSVISYWLNVLKIPVEDTQLLIGLRWVNSVERYLHITSIEEQEVLKMYHPLG
jgi:site-specific recombinase XerD